MTSPNDFARHALDPRYARQHALRGFGLPAQQRLAASRVLVVGVGGLGAPASMYLAAAGVGALTLVDTDTVDVTNLHRQLLFGTPDIGRPKLDVARERLTAINPHVSIATHDARLTADNARDLVQGHDVVIDATDNFPARYAINDACLALGVPFVYGSVARFQGQVSVFAAEDGPCYRCLFPEAPPPGSVPSCAEEGVLGVVPGVVGLHQATEAVKLLTGIGRSLAGELLLLDLLENESQTIAIAPRPDCPACGDRRDVAAASPASSRSDTVPMPVPQLTPQQVAERLAGDAPPIVLDVREPWEHETAHVTPSLLVPLGTLQASVGTLDRDAAYAVLCHHGMRSQMAAEWLQAQGFARVANIAGGIDAWSVEVDPSIPRY